MTTEEEEEMEEDARRDREMDDITKVPGIYQEEIRQRIRLLIEFFGSADHVKDIIHGILEEEL